MPTSPNKLCPGEHDKATATDHDRFIHRHRLNLLRYLDGTAPESTEEPDALAYIESVLAAWHEVFGESELKDPSLEERTFWFALYQLEDLVETTGPHIDPYEKYLLEILVEVRELLRHRRPLPEHRFMATRPDGS